MVATARVTSGPKLDVARKISNASKAFNCNVTREEKSLELLTRGAGVKGGTVEVTGGSEVKFAQTMLQAAETRTTRLVKRIVKLEL